MDYRSHVHMAQADMKVTSLACIGPGLTTTRNQPDLIAAVIPQRSRRVFVQTRVCSVVLTRA
jgi:hypothetical protein